MTDENHEDKLPVPAATALPGSLVLVGCATTAPLTGRADLLDFLAEAKPRK